MRKKLDKKTYLIILSFLFLLIIPAIIVVAAANWLRGTWIRPEVEEEKVEHLNPSQILADKIKYNDKFLVIQGQIIPETAVCERKTCPEYDPCCGCKNERDLIIADSGASLMAQSPGRLRLLAAKKESFCHRINNSCEYNCSGWKVGEIYEVRGFFRAIPPPQGSGLKLYLDYYFEVQEKEMVKTLGILEKTKALINDLKNLILSTKTTGYYILR